MHQTKFSNYNYLLPLIPNVVTCNNSIDTNIHHTNKQQHDMLDSCTTNHFISIRADIYNIHPTNKPVNVIIPNGATLTSTYECDINWPILPKEARNDHILPGLANQSLISVVNFAISAVL